MLRGPDPTVIRLPREIEWFPIVVNCPILLGYVNPGWEAPICKKQEQDVESAIDDFGRQAEIVSSYKPTTLITTMSAGVATATRLIPRFLTSFWAITQASWVFVQRPSGVSLKCRSARRSGGLGAVTPARLPN
jgi:hypothetical protein